MINPRSLAGAPMIFFSGAGYTSRLQTHILNKISKASSGGASVTALTDSSERRSFDVTSAKKVRESMTPPAAMQRAAAEVEATTTLDPN